MNLPDVRTTVSWSIVALAGGGAWVSYLHTYSAARAAGQPSACAVVYPVLTDVLVLAATVCLLHASQNKGNAVIPRWAFGLGVAATLFANVLYGARYGPLSAIVSGWPAVAFVTGVVLAHWLAGGAVTEASRDEGNVTKKKEARYVTDGRASSNGVTVTETSRDGRNVTGASSKTDLVRAELQAARAEGKDPTAAELVQSLLEQGHEVSGTLARNVVRDARVASNGHTS